jgi:hypothetical protein
VHRSDVGSDVTRVEGLDRPREGGLQVLCRALCARPSPSLPGYLQVVGDPPYAPDPADLPLDRVFVLCIPDFPA